MIKYDNVKLLDFKIHINDDVNLIAIEKGLNNFGNCPFEIKRIFYLYGFKKDSVRGEHAHKKVKQIAICLMGSCDFYLDYGDGKKIKIHLDSPNKGLFIDVNVWNHFTNFSNNCIVLVLASDYYDEKEYIRNYDDFINYKNNV